MRYRYRIWCSSCLHEDHQGCFSGDEELSDETFETFKKADEAGFNEAASCSLWEYCVVDEAGNEVKEDASEAAIQRCFFVTQCTRSSEVERQTHT